MSLWGQAFGGRSLPDGTTTTDSGVYDETWATLVEFLEAVFPGYMVVAFDPHVTLSSPTEAGRTFIMSSHAAVTLMGSVRALTAKKGRRS